MFKILLIEDDPILARGLSVNLELESYQVQWVKDLESAHKKTSESQFDLLILDLSLPDGSGLHFLKQLRDQKNQTPVVVLTAQIEEEAAIKAFELEANDFVRKPFGTKEFICRIKTALKTLPQQSNNLKFEGLAINKEARKAMYKDKDIELNRREFDTLLFFVENRERVISRAQLMSALGVETDLFDRTIDSHVSHLRHKLKKAGSCKIQINSVYGLGYRMELK